MHHFFASMSLLGMAPMHERQDYYRFWHLYCKLYQNYRKQWTVSTHYASHYQYPSQELKKRDVEIAGPRR